MVNPLEIMPVLALALMIVVIPLLADRPPGQAGRRVRRAKRPTSPSA